MRNLRGSLERMQKAALGKDATAFDQYTVGLRREAILREIDAIEAELLRRVQTGARAAAQAAVLHDRSTLEALDLGPFFGIDSTVIAQAQADAAKEVRNVTQAMRQQINQAVVKALSGELDEAGLQRDLVDAFGGEVTAHRVERIVRTEVGRTFVQQQAAGDEALALAGVDLIKVWVHKSGGRGAPGSRSEHVAIHGQERELWELFNVGQGATADTPPDGPGYRANAPHDPSLPPELSINCGCTVVRRPRFRSTKPYIAQKRPQVQFAAAGAVPTA